MTVEEVLKVAKEFGPWVALCAFLFYCLTKLGWEVFKMLRDEIKNRLDDILELQQSIMTSIERQTLIMEERMPRQGGTK